jgi:hypothetical protein
LPYHELIEKTKTEELNLSEYKVIAPNRIEFTYSSELVEHDTAIDALWRIAECLRKSEQILEASFKKEFAWIENEISVLIGPAGSGKTTVLNIFKEIAEIKKGGLIMLAPTGKARVNLGHDAQTIASYLSGFDRYSGDYQIYYANPDVAKDSSSRNIIIDESSMLTEEMLAAILTHLVLWKE